MAKHAQLLGGTTRGSPGDHRRRIAALVIAVLAAHRAVALLDGEWRLAGSALLMSSAAAGAAAVSFARARRSIGRDRAHLLLLGLATSGWLLGQVYWSVEEVLRDNPVPFPSIADIGYTSLLPLAMAGLLVAPASRVHRASIRRRAVDTVAVTASLLFVGWATYLHPVLESWADEDLFSATVGLSYPVGDALLLAVALALLLAANDAWRPALLFDVAAVASLGVADIGFAYLVATDDYATGSLIDAGWTLSFCFFALGASRIPATHQVSEGPVELAAPASMMVPIVALSLAGLVALHRGDSGLDEPMLVALLAVAFAGAIGRSWAARAEGAAYAAELKTASADLAELHARYQLALEAAGMATWEWTSTEDQVVASTHFADMIGLDPSRGHWSAEELLARVDPDDRPGLSETLAKVRDSGVLDAEFRVVHPEREPLIVRARGRTALDERGELIRAVGVAFDVTEARLAGDAVRRRDANLAAMASLGARCQRMSTTDAVFRDVTATMADLLPVESSEVWRFEADVSTLRRVALAPEGPQLGAVRLVLPGSPEDHLLRDGVPLVSDGTDEPPLGGSQADPSSLAEVCVAVESKHGPWGMVRAVARFGRSFGDEELGLIREAANLVASAVDRSDVETSLWFESRHDPLTRLPNRTFLLERLGAAVSEIGDRTTALVYLDLDDFKDVNDRFGHLVGDTMLLEVAERLRRGLRPGDLVARLGGDEFAVLLDGLADDDAIVTAIARLREVLSVPLDLGPVIVVPRASFGWVTTRDCEPEPASILRSADLAMYSAKRGGKDATRRFEAGMYETVSVEGQRADELRGALDRGELVLYYQPVADLRSGEVAGAEALIRWVHPELGVLAPSTFLPIAARIGLMPRISEWAVTEACRWVLDNRPTPSGSEVTVAVNISATDLETSRLADVVMELLVDTGLPPGRLCLEITESSVLKDPAAAVAPLEALRSLGVTVAIDDFGTGYSSLSQLKLLPVDIVKVDQTFVDGLGSELDDSAVVAAVIRMAHSLGLEVVAEGVETDAQLALLCELGCEYAQGYLLGRPAPAEAPLPHDRVRRLVAPHLAGDVDTADRQRTWTVLIADDLEDDRRLLRRTLQRSGRFRVLGEAADGLSAVELVQELEPDLAILDLAMPVLDGLAALGRVRLHSPATEVVVLSGYASERDRDVALESGALAFLTKGPVDIVPSLLRALEARPRLAEASEGTPW